MNPRNIAPFVGYLASDFGRDITGQVFIVYGGIVGRVRLPHLEECIIKRGPWSIEELEAARSQLFENRSSNVFEGPRGFARLPRD